MVTTYEQFIAFGTDIVGIERALRLFQSLAHILISYPILITLLPHPSPSPKPALAASILALTGLRHHLNVARRFIRLFRFLDSLNTGWNLYHPGRSNGAEVWLDVVAKTCLGWYGFLESATMLDVLGVEGLGWFGPERSRELNLQAQIFWFAALYASVVASGVRLFKMFAYRSVPQTGEGYGTGEKPAVPVEDVTSEKQQVKEEKGEEEELSQDEQLKKERQRLKGIMAKRKAERRAWLRRISAQVSSLGKKMLAETIDMILPTAALGWINVHPGTVGLAMFTTTIITSLDVWHRVGRELAAKKA